MRQYRHGDVLFLEVPRLPLSLKEKGGNEVARGELTGHAHVLVGEPGTDFQIFADDSGDVRAVEVRNPVDTDHQEHGRLVNVETGLEEKIAPGLYEVRRQRELDPHQARAWMQAASRRRMRRVRD